MIKIISVKLDKSNNQNVKLNRYKTLDSRKYLHKKLPQASIVLTYIFFAKINHGFKL